MKNFILSFFRIYKKAADTLSRFIHKGVFSRASGIFASARQKTIPVISSFSRLEMKIFISLIVVVFASFVTILFAINTIFSVDVPAKGGLLREGVIGAPRFINPLLAISDADRDLTMLVYSGLMRGTTAGGLITDLAENFSVSPDGLTYTFVLKPELTWHDGKPVSSDDVVFTITKAQDPVLRSPKRASWEGVAISKADKRTVVFTLQQPYSPFLENTTMGILPRHIWGEISSEQFGFSKYNEEPIGSGPYTIKTIKKDSSGVPIKYELAPFGQFSLKKAHIEKLELYFFSNEDALLNAFRSGNIDAINSISPRLASEIKNRDKQVKTFTLPRVFGVFFNQNQNEIFTNSAIRKALAMSIDKNRIVNDVLYGYGTAIESPLPPGNLGYFNPINKEVRIKEGDNPHEKIEEAKKILEDAGWKINAETGIREKKIGKKITILEFSLTTSDTEELENAASIVVETWKELGANVTLKTFNAGDLNQNIIRPRKYDALFFGEIIGRESDPLPFWHSSQRNDPGLNIALYTNIAVDNLLEKGRQTLDSRERAEIYKKFQEEITKDMPAIFVYSPDSLYVLPKKVHNVKTGTITVPSERFLDISNWFIETDRVWRFFVKN